MENSDISFSDAIGSSHFGAPFRAAITSLGSSKSTFGAVSRHTFSRTSIYFSYSSIAMFSSENRYIYAHALTDMLTGTLKCVAVNAYSNVS